uniref:Protein RFT1 homolog n=1 Tax=Panagrolaimus sp. JU765 TaxID=591449 RepID=A0AC34QA76_9BILA
MNTHFLDIFKFNFGAQFASKILTFLINSYFIRHVSINLLGLVNVRMTLLYTTIAFLVREPFRKTCLGSDLSPRQAVNFSILIYPVSLLYTCIFSTIWYFLDCPEPQYETAYLKLIMAFGSSAFIELLVEPLAIFALKTGHNGYFSFASSVLMFLQRSIAFVLIVVFNFDHIDAFCASQIAGSIVYAILYVYKFWSLSSESSQPDSTCGEREIKLLLSLTAHAFLKQALTDGAGYIMVFTDVFSLKMQGVYDIIERLGSLVTRLVLAPLEESAFIYFSSNLNRTGSNVKHSNKTWKKVTDTYFNVLKVVIMLGLVLLVFGIPYSSLAVRIYGGSVLVENNGHQMLDLYLLYLLVMAINGITECFAFATMGSREIFHHGSFLLVSSIVHFTLNVVLSRYIGVFGFIVANIVNSVLRIVYNGRYILKLSQTKFPVSFIFPSIGLTVIFLMDIVVLAIASIIFGSEATDLVHIGAHVAIGGVFFLGTMRYMYYNEQLFSPLLKKEE